LDGEFTNIMHLGKGEVEDLLVGSRGRDTRDDVMGGSGEEARTGSVAIVGRWRDSGNLVLVE
jgi:hypothetical protein